MSITNPPERRHTISQNYQHNPDRRHMNNLADRRHISPPLHINICDNQSALLNSNQGESMHQRNLMEFSQRRHGRGNFPLVNIFISNANFYKMF